MKPEIKQHYITDTERDRVVRLTECNLSSAEIADILGISKSAVAAIKQVYKACVDHDWNTVQRLSMTLRPSVAWALRVTGTDKMLEEELARQHEAQKQEEQKPEITVPGAEVPITIHPGNLYEVYKVLTDVRSLLTEIRYMLK